MDLGKSISGLFSKDNLKIMGQTVLVTSISNAAPAVAQKISGKNMSGPLPSAISAVATSTVAYYNKWKVAAAANIAVEGFKQLNLPINKFAADKLGTPLFLPVNTNAVQEVEEQPQVEEDGVSDDLEEITAIDSNGNPVPQLVKRGEVGMADEAERALPKYEGTEAGDYGLSDDPNDVAETLQSLGS